MDLFTFWYLLPVAAVAAFVTAVCGIGGGMLFLPIIVWALGPQMAIPLLTLMLIVSNATRVTLNRRHIDFGVAGTYVAGALPGAVAGGLIFVTASGEFLKIGIGAFLIASVIFRRLSHDRIPPTPRWLFAPIGAVTGFFSAIWGALGPLPAPFMISYGLRTAAFVGTAGVGALAMHLVKIVIYRRYGFLDDAVLPFGIALAACGFVGGALGKLVLDRLNPGRFLILLDILLVALGVLFFFK